MLNEKLTNAEFVSLDSVGLGPTLTSPATTPKVVTTVPVRNCLRPALAPDELGRLAHFKVTRLLGQGGMGMVFEAIDLRLNRPVALKVIHPDTQSELVTRERFLNEAQACAALRHDHIVPIYQVGEDHGVVFLAMPLLQGLPLDRWLQAHPKPHVMQILRLGREVADGLSAAHAVGIVHRDIKLANIWLEAPRGRVVLLDFGLAGRMDASSTFGKKRECVGTPGYLAPEQGHGIVTDPRSDLFSLGVVLYRLCTGKMPFPSVTSEEDYFSMLKGHRVIPPLEHDPTLPADLNVLILSMLTHDPGHRPENAKLVRTALQHLMETHIQQGVEQGIAPQILLKQSHILLAEISTAPVEVIPSETSETSLMHLFPGKQRRKLPVSILALALLLGSMLAMGLWIYDKPVADVRPTIAVDETHPIKHINARGMVIHAGRVRASLVKEASALVKSKKHPGLYWTLCDSGNPPYLFAIDATGKLQATLRLEGVANIDWEALAIDTQGQIYVGDIGNNFLKHKHRHIYRIDEPDHLDSDHASSPVSVPVTAQWHFTYPGKPFDAESLIIQDGAFWIISKVVKVGGTHLYRLPMEPMNSSGVLEDMGALYKELVAIADASLSADGKRLALVNKFYTVLYDLPSGKMKEACEVNPTFYEYDLFKVEGCTWDGDDLVMIAEDRKVYRLPLPRNEGRVKQ